MQDMKTRAVVSREYKVLLRADRFAGRQKQLLSSASGLWTDFVRAVEPLVFDIDGSLDTIENERLIGFLDSGTQHLRKGGYIFRVRRSADRGKPEITLKFRHPDRYVAEGRQMKSDRVRTEAKFEEDIKAPFVSLYSFSTRGRVDKNHMPGSLDDLARLFPDLSKRLDQVDGKTALSQVNSFTARELVITGPLLRIGSTPKVHLECALIVWYDANGRADTPVAVEFSYRYGNAAGEYGGKAARRAFDIFASLQNDMTEWLDPKPGTKTAFVYG
jgi:hypothetical protein